VTIAGAQTYTARRRLPATPTTARRREPGQWRDVNGGAAWVSWKRALWPRQSRFDAHFGTSATDTTHWTSRSRPWSQVPPALRERDVTATGRQHQHLVRLYAERWQLYVAARQQQPAGRPSAASSWVAPQPANDALLVTDSGSDSLILESHPSIACGGRAPRATPGTMHNNWQTFSTSAACFCPGNNVS